MPPTTARTLDPPAEVEQYLARCLPTARARARAELRAPHLAGMPAGEAVSALRTGGFVAAVELSASTAPAGTVIDQDPVCGSPLAPEAVVRLAVAAGPTTQPQTASSSSAYRAPEDLAPAGGLDDTGSFFAALAERRDAREDLPCATEVRARTHVPADPVEVLCERLWAPLQPERQLASRTSSNGASPGASIATLAFARARSLARSRALSVLAAASLIALVGVIGAGGGGGRQGARRPVSAAESELPAASPAFDAPHSSAQRGGGRDRPSRGRSHLTLAARGRAGLTAVQTGRRSAARGTTQTVADAAASAAGPFAYLGR